MGDVKQTAWAIIANPKAGVGLFIGSVAFAPTIRALAEGAGLMSGFVQNATWLYSLPDQNWFQLACLFSAAYFLFSAANDVDRKQSDRLQSDRLAREAALAIPVAVFRHYGELLNLFSSEERLREAYRLIERYGQELQSMRQNGAIAFRYHGPQDPLGSAGHVALDKMNGIEGLLHAAPLPIPSFRNNPPHLVPLERASKFDPANGFDPSLNGDYFAAHEANHRDLLARHAMLKQLAVNRRNFLENSLPA